MFLDIYERTTNELNDPVFAYKIYKKLHCLCQNYAFLLSLVIFGHHLQY